MPTTNEIPNLGIMRREALFSVRRAVLWGASMALRKGERCSWPLILTCFLNLKNSCSARKNIVLATFLGGLSQASSVALTIPLYFIPLGKGPGQ